MSLDKIKPKVYSLYGSILFGFIYCFTFGSFIGSTKDEPGFVLALLLGALSGYLVASVYLKFRKDWR